MVDNCDFDLKHRLKFFGSKGNDIKMFFKTNLPNFSTFLMNSLYFFAPPDQNINRKNQVNKDPHIFSRF